jgi:hypothetical protein
MTGAHAQPRRTPFWRRHKIGAAVAGLLVLGVGVAVALALFRAPIGGTVDSSDTGLRWNTAAAPAVTDTDATCSMTIEHASLANITMTNAYPGAVCTFTATVHTKNGADEDLTLTGLTLAGLPTGWTAELDPGYCGDLVPQAPGVLVGFTVTMGATATVGSGGTISAASSGVEAVPESQYQAAMCP